MNELHGLVDVVIALSALYMGYLTYKGIVYNEISIREAMLKETNDEKWREYDKLWHHEMERNKRRIDKFAIPLFAVFASYGMLYEITRAILR